MGLSFALGALTLPLFAAASAHGQSPPRAYTYVEIGVFGTASADGRRTGAAWDVNDAEQVVGASTTNVFGVGRGFLWDGRALTNRGVIGGGTLAASAAYGVNGRGDIVGQSHVNATDPPQAFVTATVRSAISARVTARVASAGPGRSTILARSSAARGRRAARLTTRAMRSYG